MGYFKETALGKPHDNFPWLLLILWGGEAAEYKGSIQ